MYIPLLNNVCIQSSKYKALSHGSNFQALKKRLKIQMKSIFWALFSGTYWGYLKCSIRGTNNQLQNIFYKFVHPQLFNIKHKFVHFQLVWNPFFFFLENHIFCKQKRMDVYGRASLVLGFKLIWKNEDLLSSRHK